MPRQPRLDACPPSAPPSGEAGGYKSVVCEEDAYLLELIRYIHLNPLRAGLVKDLQELDTYSWSGHSAILGNRKNPLVTPEEPDEPNKLKEPNEPTKSLAEKTIEDILLHFGETQKAARQKYRDFVEKLTSDL